MNLSKITLQNEAAELTVLQNYNNNRCSKKSKPKLGSLHPLIKRRSKLSAETKEKLHKFTFRTIMTYALTPRIIQQNAIYKNWSRYNTRPIIKLWKRRYTLFRQRRSYQDIHQSCNISIPWERITTRVLSPDTIGTSCCCA